jgi:hypothetical protein
MGGWECATLCFPVPALGLYWLPASDALKF